MQRLCRRRAAVDKGALHADVATAGVARQRSGDAGVAAVRLRGRRLCGGGRAAVRGRWPKGS